MKDKLDAQEFTIEIGFLHQDEEIITRNNAKLGLFGKDNQVVFSPRDIVDGFTPLFVKEIVSEIVGNPFTGKPEKPQNLFASISADHASGTEGILGMNDGQMCFFAKKDYQDDTQWNWLMDMNKWCFMYPMLKSKRKAEEIGNVEPIAKQIHDFKQNMFNIISNNLLEGEENKIPLFNLSNNAIEERAREKIVPIITLDQIMNNIESKYDCNETGENEKCVLDDQFQEVVHLRKKLMIATTGSSKCVVPIAQGKTCEAEFVLHSDNKQVMLKDDKVDKKLLCQYCQ